MGHLLLQVFIFVFIPLIVGPVIIDIFIDSVVFLRLFWQGFHGAFGSEVVPFSEGFFISVFACAVF